jgi:hypothetical protein
MIWAIVNDFLPEKSGNRHRIQGRRDDIDQYPYVIRIKQNDVTLHRRLIRQIKTCPVSENFDRGGREYHAERSAIPMYNSHHICEQGNGYQTHLNHEEHVEAIEKGHEYLIEA